MSNDVPWKAIFTSMPVWAITVANFCAMWSLNTLLTSLPQYFESILGFSISAVSFPFVFLKSFDDKVTFLSFSNEIVCLFLFNLSLNLSKSF